MKFEQPPMQEKTKERALAEARPGEMVFMYKGDAKDSEGNDLMLYAEVRQTPEDEFAVVSGRTSGFNRMQSMPTHEYIKWSEADLEAHLAASPKFKELKDANQELIRLANINNWEWGKANDYEGFEKKWKDQKESE